VGNSLQDQLLKAGLVDKKKAKQVQNAKKKHAKQQHKSKQKTVDEVKLQAQQTRQQQVERDRQLNAERKASAEKKAITAQIKQLIETNRIPREGEQAYSFADNNKIKKIYVDKRMHKQLERGLLAIVVFGDGYEVVASPVAAKIAQRNEQSVVLINDPKANAEPDTDDDYYSQFEIPDDLMW
jgi:uncharacterized protein YaiL (DUF2058 family)